MKTPSPAPEFLNPSQDLAEVLLVEDNPADIVLLKILFMELQDLHFRLHVVHNGEEALIWLKEKTLHPNNGPDLILLDINMPRMDGFALLQALSADEKLRRIPVSMLSTSNEDSDMCKAREYGAKGYMVKPATLEQFDSLLEAIPDLRLVREEGALYLKKAA